MSLKRHQRSVTTADGEAWCLARSGRGGETSRASAPTSSSRMSHWNGRNGAPIALSAA
eukprot:CAMPEP_0206247610 /NCGR_PEP_ID=MMETSP0047_2-20121206/19908_1 /ASSEMBLY_ACC=CAM_ASM_000192 /TAXON_ID=195065 /ORGANISM="Chroomonas mesostigmatica_cf, Strain CCMP1168" /LENGTH=57 /DNA_ID=CAMNT_0053673159 /DNA_START=357 /DNA_END=530 /DNA_ORIENTATION=+